MPTDATTRDGDGLAKVDNRAPDPDTLAPHLLRRRNRIVEAAIELLEDGEYDEIQIRDVAHQAGVALGTLYRYFTSKEHLYAAALLEWARSFELASIAGRPSRGESDQDRIRALLARAVKAFERWPQILRAEIAIETSADPNARAIFDEFSRRHISVMTAALRDTPEDTAEAIVGMTNSVMASQLRAWALGRTSIGDVRRALDVAVDLVYSDPPDAGASSRAS
ncbi:MAG: TetR/AcrR family transcriptional regulator [Acidimicrobiales bacterium]